MFHGDQSYQFIFMIFNWHCQACTESGWCFCGFRHSITNCLSFLPSILEFPEVFFFEGGRYKQKTFHGRGLDIFWNHTIAIILNLSLSINCFVCFRFFRGISLPFFSSLFGITGHELSGIYVIVIIQSCNTFLQKNC